MWWGCVCVVWWCGAGCGLLLLLKKLSDKLRLYFAVLFDINFVPI